MKKTKKTKPEPITQDEALALYDEMIKAYEKMKKEDRKREKLRKNQ